jgi:hypothetical protein
MIPASDDSVEVDFDNAQARLQISGLSAFDDHDGANSLTMGLGLPATATTPAIPPVAPVRAKISFEIEWNGVIDTAQITNATPPDHFKGTFFSTQANMAWSSEQEGFTFQSDPTARNLISVLGREQNGVFL